MSISEIKGNAKIAGIINKATQQDLTQAATEIRKLLGQLSQIYPTETFSQKSLVVEIDIENIENNPNLKQKMISAIKAMGMEVFMTIIDHSLANILRAGIELMK